LSDAAAKPEATEPPAHVLVVDDEPALRRSLARVLEMRGMRVSLAEDGEKGLEFIRRTPPDVALVDVMMPGMSGLDLMAEVKKLGPLCEVILMTAFADVDSAVAAMKAGAYHFLTKPFHSNDAVAHAVLRAMQHRRLAARAHRLEEELASRERFGQFIGNSPRVLEVFRLIEGVAPTSSTVLVLGESGTGKELVARAIHAHSQRADKPFVAVNCGAIPRELVESELFGHVRGAFTGANTARAGLFESADGGTILLDEVGDLPLPAQVKLLRVLQEGEIKRVGADETRTVDVRVIAATNVDLVRRMQAGEVRRDLYYRLNVIAIDLPPLRDRGDDVLLLASHFLDRFARKLQRPAKRLAPDAMRALRDYEWPGNVRELEHAIEHAMVLTAGEVITAANLPFVRASAAMREAPAPADGARPAEGAAESSGDLWTELAGMSYGDAKRRLVALFDERYTGALLDASGGNLSEAARRAGLDRSNFRRLLKRRKDDKDEP
jgi:DNA-binding NtrC family response regulator